MSVTFSSGFHLIKPGVRISGDQITSVIKGVYDSGLYSGQKFIHIDLAEEQDLTYVEEGVAGPSETVADVDALYDQLKAAGMIELFDGMLIDISDVSIISVSGTEVKFDFRGHQPYIFDRNPDPAATEIQKLANQTWLLPQVTFDASAVTLSAADGSEEIEFVSIENRLALLEATNGLIKQDYNYVTLGWNACSRPWSSWRRFCNTFTGEHDRAAEGRCRRQNADLRPVRPWRPHGSEAVQWFCCVV